MSLRVYVSYAASALHGKCCLKNSASLEIQKKVNIRISNVNFGQCLIFVYLGLQKHTNAIVKAKMGEDGVLAEYLQKIMNTMEK